MVDKVCLSAEAKLVVGPLLPLDSRIFQGGSETFSQAPQDPAKLYQSGLYASDYALWILWLLGKLLIAKTISEC